VADDPVSEYSEALVFRRGKLRKRDDPAIELFREAMAHIDDPARVRRALFELGRLYDPVRNGPIVDAASRRIVAAHLEEGRAEEARQVVDAALRRYTGPARPAAPPPGQP
jgi:hypothetical protein